MRQAQFHWIGQMEPPSTVNCWFMPTSLWRILVAQARREAPHECCGLLAGREWGQLTTYYPLRNEATALGRYCVGAGLFAPMRWQRQRRELLQVIVHSHPQAPPIPSQLDLNQNYYGTLPHLILSLLPPQPSLRFYQFHAQDYSLLDLQLVD